MTTELNDYPRKYVQINGKGPIYCLHGTSSIDAFEALEKELAELQSRQDQVREGVYVRYVPDECDRIVWRGHYYNLPFYTVPVPVKASRPVIPDGVVEALQRLIENGASLGSASSEDALLVARYRQHLFSSQTAGSSVVPSEIPKEIAQEWYKKNGYPCGDANIVQRIWRDCVNMMKERE